MNIFDLIIIKNGASGLIRVLGHSYLLKNTSNLIRGLTTSLTISFFALMETRSWSSCIEGVLATTLRIYTIRNGIVLS